MRCWCKLVWRLFFWFPEICLGKKFGSNCPCFGGFVSWVCPFCDHHSERRTFTNRWLLWADRRWHRILILTVRLSSRPQDQRRQQWSHSKSPGRISSEWCWISPARTWVFREPPKSYAKKWLSRSVQENVQVFFLPVSVYQQFRCFTITTSICGRAPVMSIVSLSPIPMMPGENFLDEHPSCVVDKWWAG